MGTQEPLPRQTLFQLAAQRLDGGKSGERLQVQFFGERLQQRGVVRKVMRLRLNRPLRVAEAERDFGHPERKRRRARLV